MDDKPLLIHRTYKGQDSENTYTRADNRLVNDTRLSPLARLAMIYLLSKPNNWIAQNFDIQRYLGVGQRKIKKIMNELKELGYIKRVPKRDNKTGKWKTIRTDVYEIPYNTDGAIPAPSENAPSENAPSETAPFNNNESLTNKLITNNGKVYEQINNDFEKYAMPQLKLQFNRFQWERSTITKITEDVITLALASPLELEIINKAEGRKEKIEKIILDNLGQFVRVEFALALAPQA